MPKASARCSHCGAKTVRYPFNFNKGLAICLRKMRPHSKAPVEIKNLGLTTSQWTNFQKLKYWGLIFPHEDKGVRKGGWWFITKRGLRFLRGDITLPKTVWMYRNKLVAVEPDQVHISNVVDGYTYRVGYAKSAVPEEII